MSQAMWVKFKKTYSGPEGVFPKGTRIELSVEKIDRIKKQFYDQSCPPWEDRFDQAAAYQAAAKAALDKANRHLANLQGSADKAAENQTRLKKARDNVKARLKVIGGQIEKGEKLADKKIAQLEKTKKPRTDKEKKAYADLEKESSLAAETVMILEAEEQRLPALILKAEGQMMIADAERELIEIELSGAQAAVEALKEKLGIKETDNDEKDSKKQTIQPAEGQGDKPITEGQTDNTGQKTD